MQFGWKWSKAERHCYAEDCVFGAPSKHFPMANCCTRNQFLLSSWAGNTSPKEQVLTTPVLAPRRGKDEILANVYFCFFVVFLRRALFYLQITVYFVLFLCLGHKRYKCYVRKKKKERKKKRKRTSSNDTCICLFIVLQIWIWMVHLLIVVSVCLVLLTPPRPLPTSHPHPHTPKKGCCWCHFQQ